MSRRDTIIISVLINAGLLSILFATAWNGDDDNTVKSKEAPIVEEKRVIKPPEPSVLRVEPSSKPPPLIVSAPVPEVVSSPSLASDDTDTLEVTVKRGDFLGKIASANGTTVEELVKLNDLRSTQLQIGQKIRVPMLDRIEPAKKPSGSADVAKEQDGFHTVQRGDSPWSIANRYNIELADILRLNNLDEESARNLRAGQRIRIRR